MPKGIPAKGKRASGGGRKAHPVPLVRRNVTMEAEHIDYLRASYRTVSAGIRLLAERDIAALGEGGDATEEGRQGAAGH